MEFELLGPLKVVENGRDLTPARPKQRALLALLLLRRGEVVRGAQLIEALWGEEPPGTAQTALHGHVSALRKLIGAERIRTRPPGYLLQAAAGEVDIARFEALIARARDGEDPGERSAGLREALALWRGEPLADLQGDPFADREIARLDELRIGAIEDRVDADLALGRHHELVPELEPLVAEHRFRERLRGQLMLALYRCGRQADALSVFQSGRQTLVDELGIEPSEALRDLERRILQQDHGLAAPAPAAPVRPPIRYARSGELNIAYQVTGDGPVDVVLISGFVSHLEKDWEEPRHARFLERLGSGARLIRFDKRGTGLSDRPPGIPDLEARMDDVRAVMDAVGSRRAVLFGYSEGAPMAILFAATHPSRTRGLVLYGAYAKRLDPDEDYPWAPTRAARAAYIDRLERDWGFEADMKIMCPSADEAMARWWGERCRAAASPGAVKALNQMNSGIDVRALLPAIRVPALVVHRGTDYDVRVEEGRYVADRIPGARFVELPGADHFVGIDPDQILDAVMPFLDECGESRTPDDRVLLTMLALPDVNAEHEHVVRAQLERFRGLAAEPSLATFDGPARAVRCGLAIVRATGMRAGVHTGEVELGTARARGLAVEIAAEIAADARPGEVLVSRTVRDLVAGSGLELADRGRRTSAGIEVLAAAEPAASRPLVGRAEELGRLEAALERARAGSGSTALVAGDAGIGKTRLARELAARAAGFEVLVGHCLDLVGTELPFQPFAEALGGLREHAAGSQRQLFEEVLARLGERAPALLVLEDLHWADASTLDLVGFLAHRLHDRRALVLATYRADEPASAERMRRLAENVRRSGAALAVELGPLAPAEVTALLGGASAFTGEIAARSEGNPFFAEELLAAGGAFPPRLRDLLLQRLERLDGATTELLRLASAAGRDVGYALLRSASGLPERDVRESLRGAVDHGVLIPEGDGFRFRHALLAEALYATLLPGEREALHARLAEALAGAAAAELAPHWLAAGRWREALLASIGAAREAEAIFGLAEALAHLERALALWPKVPDAEERSGLDLAELTAWAAERAMHTGAAPRAVELGARALAELGDADPVRAGLLHASTGRYLLLAGRRDDAVAAFRRAVELVPADPPTPERAEVVAALGHALMLTWRHEESKTLCEQALALAPAARATKARALVVLGVDLAYLGRGEEGLEKLWEALELAEEPYEELRAYTCLTDVLTMLGRPRESARLGAEAVAVIRRYGVEHSTLLGNRVEALVAAGDFEEADGASAEALRMNTANWPHHALVTRAELEVARGDFDAARAHLETALASVREDERGWRTYDPVAVELALAEGRWADAGAAVADALTRVRASDAALYRVRLCAQGLRAQAELARTGEDAAERRDAVERAASLRDAARRAAAEAGPVTPNAAGWGALAEAEYARATGAPDARLWTEAAALWERLERPPLVAYCRWREGEALGAGGAASLQAARELAARIGARPLLAAMPPPRGPAAPLPDEPARR